MGWSNRDIEAFGQFVEAHRSFLVVSHSNPDGDTIGSNISLSLLLQALGKETASYCTDPIPRRYDVLGVPFRFQRSLETSVYDAVITVDTATPKLVTSDVFAVLPNGIPLANVDHHKDNAMFGTLNVVDPAAASTTLLLFRLFRGLHWKVTPDVATGLLLGLMTDTGGFFHANTSEEAYDAAADLMLHGADSVRLARKAFGDLGPKRLKLWGRVLERASINVDCVVSSVVTERDLTETGTTPADLEGVVEYLNMVPEGRYAILLTEDGKNAYVKGSLRARSDDVDVSAIAHQFGGGGHKKASGFKIKGRLAEKRVWQVLDEEGSEELTV